MGSRVINWINRHLTHPRDIAGPPVRTVGDYGIRVVIHVFAMFALIPTFYAHWSLIIVWAWFFLKYQRNEDAHTEDQAWKDIAGGLIGIPIVSMILCWLVYGIGWAPWWIQ